MKLREAIFIATTILVLCGFAWSVYEKEELIRTGETVFLELAPRDPRSLMQGDYMVLNYKIGEDIRQAGAKPRRRDENGFVEMPEPFPHNSTLPKRGYAVIAVNSKNIAEYKRLYEEKTPMAANEKLVKFRHGSWRVDIVPNSFMFQEGHAKYYDRAKYGVFKFDAEGNCLLTGLADEKREIINPPAI